MKKSFKYFVVLLNLLLLTQTMGGAVEDKVKFDNQTFHLSNPDTKTDTYTYLLKDENIGNWHSMLSIENVSGDNPVEVSADFAYKVQSENPGASVLVYPEAATVGYLTFPQDKEFYEYNTVLFRKTDSCLNKLRFAKRFYASENSGSDGARKAAIDFAEKNNKKYMETIQNLKF